MKITDKNGIVKWEDEEPKITKDTIIWGQSPILKNPIETWYKVRGKWFHVIKANDGCAYVNGKLFPEPTPYNERMKSLGWDFHEEILFVMEEHAEEIHVDLKVHMPIEKIPLNFEVRKLVPRERKLREDYIQHTDENGDTWICPAKSFNLLPKESTMRTRYVVVNLKDKVEFEKKWELSYGYNNCPKICFDQKEAIGWINRNLGPNEKKDYVVERHNAGKIDVVWKIDGIVQIQEEDEDEDF